MEILLQIVSGFTMGINVVKGLWWFKDTKVGKIITALLILPYLIWVFYKLSKSELLMNLQKKIERGKITYYF